MRYISELVRAGADGFGVGTCISNAPTVDFALDIVEKDDRPVAKRGKFGGMKYLFKCPECLNFEVSTKEDAEPECKICGRKMKRADVKLLDHGKRVQGPSSPDNLRNNVLRQLNYAEKV